MSKIESRRERKNREAQSKRKTNRTTREGISKTYYYIIGFLFLVLFLLVFFIFRKNDDQVDLENGQSENSALVVSENQQAASSESENADTSNEAAGTEAESTPEGTTEEKEEEASKELPAEESTGDEENTPYDPTHATNYNDGSADRVAIKNEIIRVTGLDSDLIEWWVGNDGPGRVEAKVSSRDQSEVYQVYLQYGDGQWHVIDSQRIASVPSN